MYLINTNVTKIVLSSSLEQGGGNLKPQPVLKDMLCQVTEAPCILAVLNVTTTFFCYDSLIIFALVLTYVFNDVLIG